MRSKAALAKAARHTLDDGAPAHSFATLLGELAAIVRNTWHGDADSLAGWGVSGPDYALERALRPAE